MSSRLASILEFSSHSIQPTACWVWPVFTVSFKQPFHIFLSSVLLIFFSFVLSSFLGLINASKLTKSHFIAFKCYIEFGNFFKCTRIQVCDACILLYPVLALVFFLSSSLPTFILPHFFLHLFLSFYSKLQPFISSFFSPSQPFIKHFSNDF